MRVPGHSNRAAQLPLAKWQRGLGKQWVWLATVADLDRPFGEQPGRFRAEGILRWSAVGDPGAVRDMLQRLPAVGAERSAGHGRVAAWTVADLGPFDADRDLPLVQWHPDGRIARPVPVRAAAQLGLNSDALDTVDGSIRPPYGVPPPTGQLTPGTWREWREVLAPWTRQPQAT